RRQLKFFFRAFEAYLRNRKAQRLIGFIKHRARSRIFLRQLFPHAGILRRLPWKYERYFSHRLLPPRLAHTHPPSRIRVMPPRQLQITFVRFFRLCSLWPAQPPRELHSSRRWHSNAHARSRKRRVHPKAVRRRTPCSQSSSSVRETRPAKASPQTA